MLFPPNEHSPALLHRRFGSTTHAVSASCPLESLQTRRSTISSVPDARFAQQGGRLHSTSVPSRVLPGRCTWPRCHWLTLSHSTTATLAGTARQSECGDCSHPLPPSVHLSRSCHAANPPLVLSFLKAQPPGGPHDPRTASATAARSRPTLPTRSRCVRSGPPASVLRAPQHVSQRYAPSRDPRQPTAPLALAAARALPATGWSPAFKPHALARVSVGAAARDAPVQPCAARCIPGRAAVRRGVWCARARPTQAL
ncbi:hypothetical protein PsYK624_154070 [Phanerochaete sordida]|uniref:Uncharacterized protein n=1 Tax=Phanerochaete sordida TaxID=48140 RepID=A0A9P3LL93_9APHY|nr:hypothetical protein PsYK624_154070 [Phanerochaete sordida]